MTTLSIRKADKAELQAHIDAHIQTYKRTLGGYNPDTGDRFSQGAVVSFFLESKGNQDNIMSEFASLLAKGYTLQPNPVAQTKFITDQFSLQSVTVFLVKPEAPAVVDGKEQRIEGVQYQVEDIKAVTEQATASYEQEIEDHNDKVYVQELAALKAEEAAIAAQLKADDEAKAASDLERRVRERMRGSRQAKPAKQEEGAE